MNNLWLFLILSHSFFLAHPGKSAAQNDAPDPLRFEEEIETFRQWDRKNSYPEDAVLFVGSSSIRMWETAAAFPSLPVINRGFGGAVITDLQYYYGDTIGKYHPELVVFYTGDNDVAEGLSAAEVFEDYREIVVRILEDHPGVRFLYIPIKPSSSRWHLWEEMQEVNRRVRAYNGRNDRLYYVDLATPLIGEDGRPDDSLFLDDRLHLNDQGYAVWNRVIGPVLGRIYSEATEK